MHDGSAGRATELRLIKRIFGIDVETCPRCGGRMRLLDVITDLASVARFLRHRGEATARSRSRPTVLAEQDCTTIRPGSSGRVARHRSQGADRMRRSLRTTHERGGRGYRWCVGGVDHPPRCILKHRPADSPTVMRTIATARRARTTTAIGLRQVASKAARPRRNRNSARRERVEHAGSFRQSQRSEKNLDRKPT